MRSEDGVPPLRCLLALTPLAVWRSGAAVRATADREEDLRVNADLHARLEAADAAEASLRAELAAVRFYHRQACKKGPSRKKT